MAAEAGIFVHWTNTVRGLPVETVNKVFAEAIAYNERKVADGTFESYTVQGVPAFGLFILSLGQAAKIDAALASEEFGMLVAKGNLVAENLTVRRTSGIQQITSNLQLIGKARQELGI